MYSVLANVKFIDCTFGSQDCLTNCPFGILYTAVVNTCAVLCVMYFFHICTILSWEDFLHRSFRYPLALSKRASLTLKFWMLWNEVCLYQAQSITGDLQTLEDALTFFGQSFLFTMKLLFCRISFGQMRRQIIDLVVGKRIVSISSDLWYVEESRNVYLFFSVQRA
ncbi:hypothetical protein D917_09446 [Trichinella nativa]|uniref:Uncharacterized protein n=1 Tax=Trichinella nativa TaxID=6335 RepID=A0A1Y3EFH6_9BILA|nr:hypothetical protein D917_09446 [Trichinella nativa]